MAQAGLRVAARKTWKSVSVASVASELSVTPMALYRVVPDAEQLKRLIADAAAQPIQPEATRAPLLEALRAWAVAAHEHLGGLPGLAGFVIHEWTELPAWLAIVEAFLAAAEREGLNGSDAVATVNAVFAYVLARAQARDSISRRRRLVPVKDHPERFPHVLAERSEFETAHVEAAFAFGLDALCGGLQSSLVPAPATIAPGRHR